MSFDKAPNGDDEGRSGMRCASPDSG